MNEQYAIERGWPTECPVTGRPFFMGITHWRTGYEVPTYGGPFDSYTIPEADAGGDFSCERYDHDVGGWLQDEWETVGLYCISHDDWLIFCEAVEALTELRDWYLKNVGLPAVRANRVLKEFKKITTNRAINVFKEMTK